MRKFMIFLCCFVLLAIVGCTNTAKKGGEVNSPATRIGVYDSRAIAVAFVGSEVYRKTAGKKMSEMMSEYQQAAARGDTNHAAEIKAWGKAQQDLLHRQGFSTAPVDNILAYIDEQLPGIKKQANVERLVSKWDARMLQKYPSVEQVDVTVNLIEAFKPSPRQKKSAIAIQKHAPIPLDKIKVPLH